MSDSWVVDSCDGLHDIEAAMNDVKPHDRNVRCTHRLRPVPFVRPPAFRTPTDDPTAPALRPGGVFRSEEHTSELQSLMRISYAVFCLKKKKTQQRLHTI